MAPVEVLAGAIMEYLFPASIGPATLFPKTPPGG